MNWVEFMAAAVLTLAVALSEEDAFGSGSKEGRRIANPEDWLNKLATSAREVGRI